ncbi:hypothetical protein PR202_gb14854 [Eleusine coracana subsp. coracana]|uniref:Peptidase A1 domain-containing protein n=1 Tax=Eleusine coracana subsp. coracana TaxID=191504 RepID=A0AAV5EWV6_ELECO|nr:hypothetical protein PR202_gb14854 [Eleusine coracana subsp. coracana]
MEAMLRRLLCFCLVVLHVSTLHLRCHALVLPLTNTLSSLRHTNNDTAVHHLIRSSSLRSAARHLRHRGHHRQLSLPLSPGSDYTLSLSVGPPSSATPVASPRRPTPTRSPLPATPAASTARRRSAPRPHAASPPADLCAAAGCALDDIETGSCRNAACPALYYAYGDGSLVAHLHRGRVGLGVAASVAVRNFTFACAHAALGEPVGVAGFGRGPLSFPAQLGDPALAGRFSYCLVAHSFRADRLIAPSPLILGRATDDYLVYTPLLHNPRHPYLYSVALEAVSVGGTRVEAARELGRVDRAGNGGMVVDSGTTFTMLPDDTYARVAREFARAMAAARFKRAETAEVRTGLVPCYYYYSPSAASNRRGVPPVALHFRGNATVALPRRNYFMGFKSEEEGRDVACLMLMNAGDASGDGGGGPAGTLGNFQQQGFEVVYDVDAGRVGFARRRCTELWDTLSRR